MRHTVREVVLVWAAAAGACLLFACGPSVGGERPELTGTAGTGEHEAPPVPDDPLAGDWTVNRSVIEESIDADWTSGGQGGLQYVCSTWCAVMQRCGEAEPDCVSGCVSELGPYADDQECMNALNALVDCLDSKTCEELEDWETCAGEYFLVDASCPEF